MVFAGESICSSAINLSFCLELLSDTHLHFYMARFRTHGAKSGNSIIFLAAFTSHMHTYVE